MVLAVFLLVFPVMGDLAAVMAAAQKYVLMTMWVLTCYGVVVFPWLRSLIRHRREPHAWAGRGMLMATSIILGIHALLLVIGAIHWSVTSWTS